MTKKSSGSRVIAKTKGGRNDANRRAPKRNDKMKKYSLRALNEYFENKFSVSIDSEESLSLAQKRFRNKYLFPQVKEGAVYKRSDVIFDEQDARIYLEMLSRTLDKSDDHYMEEVPYLELSNKELDRSVYKSDNIIIKKNSNLSTISDACSGNDEAKQQESADEEYIDEYEQEYLDKLKRASKQDSRKPQMKWIGKALDSYRLVENHKRSGIFYDPYVPCDIDSLGRRKNNKRDPKILYPITLKTIGVQLSLDLYKSYEDFKYDMK
jgi:hypothetical protein